MTVGLQIDTAELFYVLLASSSSVLAQIQNGAGTHIYGPPGLPNDFIIQKSIMYLGDGGLGNINIPLGQEEFQVYCYGKDAQEARAVFLAVRTLLHRKKHIQVTLSNGTAVFQYAQLMAGPQDRVEPLEGWPYVYSSFLVHFMETTIA